MRVQRRILNRIAGLWRFRRSECDVRIRLRQPVIGAALIALLTWLILAPHPLAVTGLVTLGSLMVFSYVWVRSLAGRVTTQRTLRYSAVQVGDELEEPLTLDNRSRAGDSAEFVDQSTAPGYSISVCGEQCARDETVALAHIVLTARRVFTGTVGDEAG
jgi:hypothetical protein